MRYRSVERSSTTSAVSWPGGQSPLPQEAAQPSSQPHVRRRSGRCVAQGLQAASQASLLWRLVSFHRHLFLLPGTLWRKEHRPAGAAIMRNQPDVHTAAASGSLAVGGARCRIFARAV